MSETDSKEREMDEAGNLLRTCECGYWQWIDPPADHMMPRAAKKVGWRHTPTSWFPVRSPFICEHCGSYCDASGHATPGVLVLWEAFNEFAKNEGHRIGAYLEDARASLAAREGGGTERA